MEGGIGVILVVILVVLVVGGGIFMYLTGALTSMSGDKTDGSDEPRPDHKTPGDEVQEKTEFVGTRRED